MAWSTNGTFIWPTDDRDAIGAKGPHIAIKLNTDTAEFCGRTPVDMCEWIVGWLNAAEAGSGTGCGRVATAKWQFRTGDSNSHVRGRPILSRLRLAIQPIRRRGNFFSWHHLRHGQRTHAPGPGYRVQRRYVDLPRQDNQLMVLE
jgi:hypothetical protein